MTREQIAKSPDLCFCQRMAATDRCPGVGERIELRFVPLSKPKFQIGL